MVWNPYICSMKKCGKCGVTKARTEFHANPTKKDGLQSMCKECRKEYHREHYLKNSTKYKAQVKARKVELRDFIRRYKSLTGCKNCGDKRHYVLDFHHLHGKDFSVGEFRGKSLKRIKAEIRKCEVLCANCHREVHYNAGDA